MAELPENRQTNVGTSRKSPRFTLIELLIALVIIAILASILLPALAQAKYTAKVAVCVSNQKQIGLSWMVYANDYDRLYPDYGYVRDGAYQGYLNETFTRADGSNYSYYNQRLRQSPRYRPNSWADRNNSFPQVSGDLRPLVSPYLGPLDEIVRCPLEIPYFRKNHVFEKKDADGNYLISGYPSKSKGPLSTYWIWPGENYFRVGETSHNIGTAKRSAMRKVGQSFKPGGPRNPAGLKFDIILNDCAGMPGTYGGRSLYGPLSSHPSRTGDSVEHGSYADFFWWDWNTPQYVPVTASFTKADGSITTYWTLDIMREYDRGRNNPDWMLVGVRGTFLPTELASEE